MSLTHATASLVKLNAHMIKQSIKHPKTEITYQGNPSIIKMPPAPWYLSIICIVLGATLWFLSVHFQILEMCEASRILLYGGIGNILGINVGIKNSDVKKIK